MKNLREIKKMRENGITLVALVITIIILLILAGISISALTNTGIFGKAKEAKSKTGNIQNEEQKQLDEIQELVEANGNEYIKNDELEENKYLKTFITEWTVNEGDTIVLPIYQKQEEDEERGEKETYFKYDFQVDYGDGTVLQVKSYDDENRKHTYKNAGTYNVKIDGICEAFSADNVTDSKDKITKLVQWGVINAKHYDFSGCINLNGTIPLPARNSFVNVESFRLLFYKCEKLKGTIPKDLFKYAPNVITMANIFNFATGLTGTIPEELFTRCEKVTNFRYAFAGANFTGEIPENLFKNNKEVKNFKGVFSYCINLNGTLPKNILENSENIITIREFMIGANNINVDEVDIKSPNITEAEENGFVNINDGKVKIYVTKDSETEATLKQCFKDNNNVIIEYI